MTLRTKTLDDSFIVTRNFSADCKYVDFQPGNGTKYQLLFTKLSVPTCVEIGCEPGSWLVSLLNFKHVSHPIAADGFLAWYYVQEKFGVGAADAVVLAEAIAAVLGRTCKSSEEIVAEDAQNR